MRARQPDCPGRASGRAAPLVLVLLLAVAAVLIWFASRPSAEEAHRPPAVLEGRPAETVLPAVLPDAEAQSAPSTAPVSSAERESAPLRVEPVESLPGRAIIGQLVRASDDSPVGPAEVIALEPELGTQREVEMLRERADTDGHFTLRAPRGPTNFRVLVPGPGQPRDTPHPERNVAVKIEWAGGDPTANDVRLVLSTGWRLDVRVIGADGQPSVAAVVQAAGRSAQTGADGACALLDLPEDGRAVTVSVQVAGAPAFTQSVQPPPADRLRTEAQVTVP